jgi:hypothetical protein
MASYFAPAQQSLFREMMEKKLQGFITTALPTGSLKLTKLDPGSTIPQGFFFFHSCNFHFSYVPKKEIGLHLFLLLLNFPKYFLFFESFFFAISILVQVSHNQSAHFQCDTSLPFPPFSSVLPTFSLLLLNFVRTFLSAT